MKSTTAVIGFIVLAIVFAALAVNYWLGMFQVPGTSAGVHHKHALVLGALALLSLVAANFARPKPALG